ncbi:MAG: hypothetical protein RIT31_881, partial [Actinomycetota bacterium]
SAGITLGSNLFKKLHEYLEAIKRVFAFFEVDFTHNNVVSGL